VPLFVRRWVGDKVTVAKRGKPIKLKKEFPKGAGLEAKRGGNERDYTEYKDGKSENCS